MSGSHGQRSEIAEDVSSEDGDEQDGDEHDGDEHDGDEHDDDDDDAGEIGDDAGETGDEDQPAANEVALMELGSPWNSSDDEVKGSTSRTRRL